MSRECWTSISNGGVSRPEGLFPSITARRWLGLMANHDVDPDDFLADVHDIEMDVIEP